MADVEFFEERDDLKRSRSAGNENSALIRFLLKTGLARTSSQAAGLLIVPAVVLLIFAAVVGYRALFFDTRPAEIDYEELLREQMGNAPVGR